MTNIFNIPMDENDADAKTIGEYLQKLFTSLWNKKECFSAKYPFGNSGWKYEIYNSLAIAKIIKADIEVDEDGNIEIYNIDTITADKIILETIKELFKKPE